MLFSEMNLSSFCQHVVGTSAPRFLGTHVNIFRFTLNGIGTMRSMNSAISSTKRTKT